MPEPLPVPLETDLSVTAPETLPPPTHGVVRSSAIWIGLGFGLGQVLRFVSSVVLARLLYPEAFGLLSLTFAVLTGLHLFADFGIRVSIIQNPRGDEPNFLNTAWTIQIIRGFVLWIGAGAIAWPMAFMRPEAQPALLWLLPLVGITSVLEGFTSTKLLALHRHLAQKKAVLIELLSSISGFVVMISWASLDPGVLALAAGPIAGETVKMILSHLLPGPRNRVRWDKSAVRELVHFAKWIYISTIFSFLADQVDKVIVSFLSVATLGVYHIANQFAMVPVPLMMAIARQLVFPLYSRMLEAGRDINSAARQVQMRAGALAALLIAGLIATGPTLVRCLYDERYRDAGWILPLLATSAWFQILEANAGSLLFAKGMPRLPALGNATKVLCLAIGIPIGIYFDGLRGLILALIIGDLGRYLFSGLALRRQGIAIFRRDIGWTIFVATMGLGVRFGVAMWSPELPVGTNDWPRLIERLLLEGAIVVGCWAVVVGFGLRIGWFRREA